VLTRINMLRVAVGDPLADPDQLDLVEAQQIATGNGVIVRLAETLRTYDDVLPPLIGAAAAQASAVTQRKLDIVDRLSERCTALGVRHAFIGVAERYPDSASIALLVDSPWSARMDRAILQDLPSRAAKPRRPGARLERRLAGITTHQVAYDIELRIRHGRLGRFGEHARFARLLLERASVQSVGCASCFAPTPEDYLLFLITERAYMRPSPHLADFVWAVPALGTTQFNWDYVFGTSLSLGVTAAAASYIGFLEGVHRNVSGARRDLVPATVRERMGVVAERRTAYPRPRAVMRTFAKNLRATLEAGRWQSAARLALFPFVAASARLAGGRIA